MFHRLIGNSLKSRIISTFTLIMIFLVVFMAIISYRFVRNLYLEQISEQVRVITSLMARQIQPKYIKYLDLGMPVPLTRQYFHDLFSKNTEIGLKTDWMIFNHDFNIVIHSDSTKLPGIPKPQLIINKNEILGLQINQVSSSMPFKGDDGLWYLWGFYRLEDNYWLALQESANRLKRVEDFAWFFWITGIIGIVLTMLIGYLLARAITRPIDRLVKFSSELGKGNFSYPVPNGKVEEINLLSSAMDKMRQDLVLNRQERENMLAQIAHEIRNPLGSIELLTSLIKEDISKGKANSTYLDTILKEVSALKALITSYLNYSRPQPAQSQWVSMNQLKKEIDHIIEHSLKEKDVAYRFSNKIEKIWFDPNHLKQIIVNLLNNSLDAIPTGGEIFLQSQINGNNWEIEIRDTGNGIPKENLTKIFEPFFTTKSEGTGLGLAISRKLCYENQAHISVAENNSNGCTFTIIKEIVYDS
jgi:signal transduction histidine kinase